MKTVAARTGATFNRHGSSGDIGTPPEFIQAVEHRFGPIAFDLAAVKKNAVAPRYFTKRDNALKQPWRSKAGRNNWLNPPFGNIKAWAKKCAEEASPRCRILLLVPAAVGSNWFRDYCFRNSLTLLLNGRIQFVGQEDPYPKDLMLCCFGHGVSGVEIWSWRTELDT